MRLGRRLTRLEALRAPGEPQGRIARARVDPLVRGADDRLNDLVRAWSVRAGRVADPDQPIGMWELAEAINSDPEVAAACGELDSAVNGWEAKTDALALVGFAGWNLADVAAEAGRALVRLGGLEQDSAGPD